MKGGLISLYAPSYIRTLVYMLQSTEYQVSPYLKWYWRTQNFSSVARRRQLEPTAPAKLLSLAMTWGMLLQIALGISLIYAWYHYGLVGGWAFGLALIIAYPVTWAHAVVVPLIIGRVLIVKPHERLLIVKSKQVFREHKGAKIAIVGSYGKTSMKELLRTVLGEGKKVAATPANKNVAISHARFAQTLAGDEDIVLIEYGEGAPGDVARFVQTTYPTHAVITGVAAAHLDRYKTIERAAKDIFSVSKRLEDKHVFVNCESPAATPFIRPEFARYDQTGALGWKVSHVQLSITGISFTLKKGKQILALESNLLGRHQIGPLSLAAALAHDFGLTNTQIVKAVAKTAPFEHRMQPYQLNGGWVIDDTYNGNLEGVRAGTELLHELSAKRKLYVTPGLVDQGRTTRQIHEEMGRLIAASGADTVILMQNSVTQYIKQGLENAAFTGEVIIEIDPLMFYTNLNQFVAASDVTLLQNDWPDNYK